MEDYKPKYRRRRRRRTRIVYRAAHMCNTFLKKIRLFFQSLKPPMRIALCVLGVAVVGATVVLLLPGADKQPQAAVLDPITLHDPGPDPDVMTLQFEATPSPEPTPVPTPTPDPTLEKGMSGEEVEELQKRLMVLGYLDIDEPTQLFGPATKDAVTRFQRQHQDEYQLEMDGIAGPLTLEALFSDSAKKYTLLQGTDGTDVENFQRQLKDLGYLSKVTGHYGDETVAAVKAFQKRNSLSEDGKAGQKTLELINSDQAKPSPELEKQKRSKANIDKMIETAKKQLGKKYILGNTGPNSFDCSGLVYYCLREAGSNRRRLNAAGYSNVSDWTKITSYSKLQKGDLLFFYNDAKTKVGHVGIYIGGGEMIDASSGNGKVVRRSCTTSYWKSHFVCARRPW